jgi:nucleoid DNA-binding protein
MSRKKVKRYNKEVVPQCEILERIRNRLNDKKISLSLLDRTLKTAFLEIAELVSDGKAVKIEGFGVFHSVYYPDRKVLCPTNAEVYYTPPFMRPSFLPSQGFKHKVRYRLDASDC